MVMDGFEESVFEGISDIENAIAAIGEAAWPVRADMGERRHQIRRTVSAYPPVRWHKVQIADGRHDPGICLLLCRNRSEEHTSELQSLMRISYAVFCLKKKKKHKK